MAPTVVGVAGAFGLKPFLVLILVVLAACVLQAQSVGTPDSYSGESEISPQVDPHFAQKIQQTARELQEQFRTRVSLGDAVGDGVPVASSLRQAAKQQAVTAAQQSSRFAWFESLSQGLLSLIAFLLIANLVLRKLAPRMLNAINDQFNPWSTKPAPSTDLSTNVRAEETSFSEFLAVFRAGPSASRNSTVPVPSEEPGTPSGAVGEAGANAYAVKDFLERAVIILDTQRKLLEEIDRTSEEEGRQKMLTALRWEIYALKSGADFPELLPIWQVAFAVEGLLKQLTDNAANVTASTLRTVAGGVNLLTDLCEPGLAPDLLTRRPLKLLAVDDDPISRKAVSLALKRALNEPDLAANGEAALALATQQAYDVIFLDVQMPGMDGYELCTKIHGTVHNSNTPVVFVTCHSDFDSRAQSTLSGGSDLLGKPFLTFEITVKALTFALRGRLSELERNARAAVVRDSVQSPPQLEGPMGEATWAGTTTDCVRSSQSFAAGPSIATEAADKDDIATEFLTRASAHLAPLQEAFQTIFQTEDETTRQDMLADVYLRLHSFTPKDDLPALHPAIQMSAALEGLLRKLLENPRHATVSTLVTLAAGVELLNELCELGLKSELITNPPIHLLVVDDDPVARRAVSVALQMAFEKPETAASGAAALTLASRRPFDVIFLDVQMPVMDGFTVCSRIRQTVTNQTTPVVFVTGQNDFKSRTQMSACGGNDFVGKPFLISEITVKALTFALRGRLGKIEMAARNRAPAVAISIPQNQDLYPDLSGGGETGID